MSENCLEVSDLMMYLFTEMISLISIDVYAIRIRKSGVFAFLIRMALYKVPSESIFTLTFVLCL